MVPPRNVAGAKMYLSKLTIENMRGLLGGAAATRLTLPRAGWCVFAGRNGSGKTTLLRAIALGIAGPDNGRVIAEGSFAGWVRKGETSASVALEVVGDVADKFSKPGAPAAVLKGKLSFQLEGDEPEPIVTPTPSKPGTGMWRTTWGTSPRGWLAVAYGAFRRLGKQAPELPASSLVAHQARLTSLFREDHALTEGITWLKQLNHQALEGDGPAKDLLADVLELLNDDLLPDGAKVVKVSSRGVEIERAGVRLDLLAWSDGYRVALALLLDLVRNIVDAYGKFDLQRDDDGRLVIENGALVLIDEIEAHLHVSWQQKIGFWLTERFPNVQFLVTTHSPFICQAAHREGLFLLPAPGEVRGVERADQATYNQVVNGSIDDAVLSKLFGLEHAKSLQTLAKEQEWATLRMQSLEAPLSDADAKRKRELEADLPFPFESLLGGR